MNDGGSNNSGRVLQVRLLETGAWRFRGCSRLVRDVGGNAENPGRNQGELRSWEEAGNPGRNKEKQTRVRRKLKYKCGTEYNSDKTESKSLFNAANLPLQWSVRFCAEFRIWWALVGSGRLFTGDVD